MRKKYYLTADAFALSMKKALRTLFDVDASLKRIKGSLSHKDSAHLQVKRCGKKVLFYEYADGKTTYLRKQSPRLYKLARQRYCRLLYEVLRARKQYGHESAEMEERLGKLTEFTKKLDQGNLELARVVMTPKQYKWFAGVHRTKKFTAQPGATEYRTNAGTRVRSKSESHIGNALEALGVPYIYELQMRIDVFPLVQNLQATLNERNLYSISGNTTFWNVPTQLEWMNSPGSIWRSYYYRDGHLTIYPDFSVMLADGEVLVWEHEGPSADSVYRCNASERVFVMQQTKAVDRKNLVYTFEYDVLDAEALDAVISERILSRLWF